MSTDANRDDVQALAAPVWAAIESSSYGSGLMPWDVRRARDGFDALLARLVASEADRDRLLGALRDADRLASEAHDVIWTWPPATDHKRGNVAIDALWLVQACIHRALSPGRGGEAA